MALIYCPQELDGVITAAIITRHAYLSRKTIKFGGYLYHETLTEQLKQMPQENIFILDMPSKKEHAAHVKNVMYWSTHDPNAHTLPVRIFDHTTQRLCAAQLAQQRFLPHDIIAHRLAQLAHDYTYWKHGTDAQQLADLINAGHNPQEIIDTLAKGITWSNKFQHIHEEYQHKKHEALAKLHKSLVVKRYLTYNIGYAQCPRIIGSAEAGHHLLQKHHALDIIALIYNTGKLAFRRTDQCTLDLQSLAKILDGGGQPYAAGATIPKQSYQTSIAHIDEKIKQYFAHNSNV